jgi:tripartite-type tricarboxylate transporter receptor subunit TctC
MKRRASIVSASQWLACAIALFGLFWSTVAQSQAAWPSKTIRIVVPYTPGGGNDILARLLAEKLTTSLGQPVVVENKPGAGAVVGTDFVAKAAPDGYTLLVAASGPMVFNQVLLAKPPYNSVSDFAPISMVGSFPLILGVIDSSPSRTFNDLVQWSKAHANSSNYSYPAASFQLVMELIKSRSGLVALNVPYPGSAPSINAVMTQEVQMTLVDSGPIASLLKAGKLRALAVTSDQRMPAYPQVPTLKEQGIDLAVSLWTGLFAPAGTPAPIVKRLEEEVAKIMRMPDTQERLAKLDIRPIGGASAELGRVLSQEIDLWQQVAKANNIKPQ